MIDRANIFNNEYSITKIHKVLRSAHKPGTYDNSRCGRYSDCFVYVLKGAISYTYDDCTFTANEGDIAYLPKNGKYIMQVYGDDEFIFVDFEFDCSVPKKAFAVKFNSGKELFDKLWVIWQKMSASRMTECKSVLYKIYANVIDKMDKKSYVTNSLKKKMEKSVEEMVLNYANSELSVEDIIKHSGICPTQYRALFQKIYNMSPKQYILKLKIDYAKSLLERTENNLSKIADMCGFSDEFYFSAIFKKKCACSPSKYRELSRER